MSIMLLCVYLQILDSPCFLQLDFDEEKEAYDNGKMDTQVSVEYLRASVLGSIFKPCICNSLIIIRVSVVVNMFLLFLYLIISLFLRKL